MSFHGQGQRIKVEIIRPYKAPAKNAVQVAQLMNGYYAVLKQLVIIFTK